MKRTLFLLFVLLSFSCSAQNSDAHHLDSLLNLTSQYHGNQLVDLFIEIAQLQGVNDVNQAQQSADEAIRLAKQIKYPLGVGNAYLAKGKICALHSTPLKGEKYYLEAEKVFSQIDDRSDKAKAQMGLGECYSKQGKYKLATAAYQKAINYFNYTGNFGLLAKALYQSGTNYRMASVFDSALIQLEESSKNYAFQHDLKNQGIVLNSIGVVHYNMGNYQEAVDAWTRYGDIMHKLKDWHRVSASLINRGQIYIYWGAYDEALTSFSKAMEMEKKSGNYANEATIYNSMATVFHYSGNTEKALEFYRKSLVTSEKRNQKSSISVGLHNIGELYLDTGNADSALYYIQKSLQIENTLFNKVGIAETKATLGKVYLALKKYRVAFSFLEQSKDIFLGVGDRSGLADVYQKYGQAYNDIGNDSLCEYYLYKSIEIAEEMNLKKMQFENHQILAEHFERKKQYKEALIHQKLFYSIHDSVFNQQAMDKTAYLSIKVEKEAQDRRLSELKHQKYVATYENKIKDYIVYFVILIFIILVIFFYLRYTANKKSSMRLNDQYQIVLESEEKIKALLDASHDIVLLVDRKGIIVSANAKAEKTFRNGGQVVGYNFKEVIEPYFQNQFDPQIAKVLKSKKAKQFNLFSTNKRTYDITISPIFKHGIEVSGLAVYLQDITLILSAESEKKKLEKQLFQVQKLESVGTMAGGVAHDFNNYLGTILGYSSMGFDDTEEGSSEHRYFDQIMKASKSAQHTVQKILTFSRKNETISLNRVDLVAVAKEAMNMVESTKPKEVQLLLNHEVENIEILGNDVEIQQVFINLFNNAFHAMEAVESGILKCDIKTHVFKENHQAIVDKFKAKSIVGIHIQDNGIGMDEQILQRIFEPFFTTKDVGSGTGLGLSVVHGIIKNHKGDIRAESKIGEGSSFFIYFPAIT
jgi:PAS domain S-box-containing protein